VAAGGHALTLNVRLNIDQQTGSVSGQLNASPGTP
jgi:hypothetical protein